MACTTILGTGATDEVNEEVRHVFGAFSFPAVTLSAAHDQSLGNKNELLFQDVTPGMSFRSGAFSKCTMLTPKCARSLLTLKSLHLTQYHHYHHRL